MDKLVYSTVLKEVTLANIKRLFYISLVAMPVSIAHIVIFCMNISQGNAQENKWRMGILISHALLASLMGLIGGCTFFLRKKDKVTIPMHLFQYICLIVVFIFGVIIVTIDQLVTASITPFLIACIVAGVIFLIRPFISVLIFFAAYASFYYALSLTQTNPAILLSNRVNGITATGIGLFLSIVMWRTTLSNMSQKQLITEQQTELVKKNRELEYLAFYDQMTGVYNRRKFEELLKNEIALINRYQTQACIVLADIDYFKEINDNHGHPVGDRVIQEIANVLKKNIRETDAISRWGGEEFLILLTSTPVSDGKLVAEKLRKIVETFVLHIQDIEIRPTASFGVAMLTGKKEDSLQLAYKNADIALYLAKEKGRNRVEVIFDQ